MFPDWFKSVTVGRLFDYCSASFSLLLHLLIPLGNAIPLLGKCSKQFCRACSALTGESP